MSKVRPKAWYRAAVYFTLLELVKGKAKVADELWRKLIMNDEPVSYENLVRLLKHHALGLDVVKTTYAKTIKAFDDLSPRTWILERGATHYPSLLAKTADAPAFLFAKGRLELLTLPALAVVGTRNPTEEGRRRAYKLGHLLAKKGIVVASGLALGVDEAAHLGALQVGGNTIAVIGTPINQVYPKEHVDLQALIGRAGLLVSQFHPGSKVQRYNFPIRNAVMSGLCLGTIVVEASETSGALIQARKCLQQGRKLFIPKSAVDNPALTWPKTYLERGAIQFSSIDEIIEPIEQLVSIHRPPVSPPDRPLTEQVCL